MHRVPAIIALALVTLAAPAMAKKHAPRRQPPDKAPATPLAPSAYDARDDIFYHFMPIAWRYATPASQTPEVARANRFGNFAGMTASLPYLKSLGVTGVWINPIFPSPAYHGYQHGAADGVNPWFGDEAEFWAFVRAAKSQGIKVYLDLVAYGISQQSVYFTDAHKNPASVHSPMLAFTKPDNSAFTGYSFKTWNGETVGFVNWDLRNAAARDLVIAWSKKWLDPNADGDPSDGVDGFRLDHVWSKYDKGPGGWGYNTDDFWRTWRAELEKVNPRVFTFAEQSRWETTGADLLCTSDGASTHDAAFTKPFEFAAREALSTGKAKPLYDAMRRTVEACPKGRTFMAIIGDHDVDRVASAIGADTPESIGRAKAAAAVLMLQPFPPVLYAGDEIGMLGKAGDYRSDANDIPRREPMKWTATDSPEMTDYWALHPRVKAAAYSKYNDGRSVQEQDGVRGSLLETYRALAALRASTPALRRGEYIPLIADHPGVWAFQRGEGDKSVRVAINLTGKPLRTRIEAGATIELDPYAYAVTIQHDE